METYDVKRGNYCMNTFVYGNENQDVGIVTMSKLTWNEKSNITESTW